MKRALLLSVILSMGTLAACGDDDDTSGADTTASAGAVSDETTDATTEESIADTTAETAAETSATETTAVETTEASTASTSATGNDAACDALREISEYDTTSNQLLAGGGDIEQIKKLFVELTPDVLAAYDRVAAAEPELVDETTTLSEFTAAAAEASKEAKSFDELLGVILGLPGVMEAGAAGLSLNAYAEENCGFSTGNQSG